jgi:hypothetical protein
MSAAELYAQLTRQQWQDYVSRFIPIENELIEYAMNPETVRQNVAKAQAGIGQAFDTQQGVTERRLRANQQTLTGEEKAAADQQTGLSRSLGEVQAANTARQITVERQRGILGAMPTPQVQQGR